MTGFGSLTKRGLKLFFKDKGMLFSSLITPIILLVLYITFLAKVYNDSFVSSLEAAHFSDFPQELIVNLTKERFDAYLEERKQRLSAITD